MRKLKNKPEQGFVDFMLPKGWELTKRGWPDFFCTKGKKIALVEVKSSRSRKLKRQQYRTMVALAKFGVPCYRWNAEEKNFEQIRSDCD